MIEERTDFHNIGREIDSYQCSVLEKFCLDHAQFSVSGVVSSYKFEQFACQVSGASDGPAERFSTLHRCLARKPT